MKAIIFILLLSVPVFADDYPATWALRDNGYTNCIVGDVYNNKFTCDEDYFQTFECDSKQRGDVVRVKVLAVGKITSDVASECSPIVSFSNFIEQAR